MYSSAWSSLVRKRSRPTGRACGAGRTRATAAELGYAHRAVVRPSESRATTGAAAAAGPAAMVIGGAATLRTAAAAVIAAARPTRSSGACQCGGVSAILASDTGGQSSR